MADQRKKRGAPNAAPAGPARASRVAPGTAKRAPAVKRAAAAMRTPVRLAAPASSRRAGAEPPTKAAAGATAGRAGRGRRLATPTAPATKASAGRDDARRKSTSRAGHAAPARSVKIKELNAQGKCGPGTSVVHLFRVDEVRDGTPAVHLVFFDRHGWYCEHGRSCHAVDDVRRLAGSHVARTYSVG